MKVPTPADLVAAFSAHGYPVPVGLHVVALRKKGGTLDSFDDMILVVDGSRAVKHAARCTPDPGKVHREKPMNAAGCAVWAVGQVVDAMKFGKHHGEYDCLVPARPIPVLRYDSLTDTTGTPSTASTTNIHRASESRESSVVGAWSAGCIVYANPTDFGQAMDFARASGQTRFTVTLLEWS